MRISSTAPMLVVMNAVLECDELAAVEGDRRIADVDLSQTPIGCAIDRRCLQTYFQSIVSIAVDGDYVDREKSKVLLPIFLKFPSVSEFSMFDRISGEDAVNLIPAVKIWAEHLVDLRWGSDEFGDLGAIEVSKLIPLFTAMKKLSLHRCGLTDVAGMAIVEALTQNQNIIEVYISENMFTDSLVNALVDYILKPSNLVIMKMTDNKFSIEGKQRILEAWEKSGRRYQYDSWV